jgi:short-subunit dehydrogenase
MDNANPADRLTDLHDGASAAPLAVITGASSGIGLELARIAADRGYRIIAAADTRPADGVTALDEAADVEWVEADLATSDGVAALLAAVGADQIALLCANAGEGLGDAFVDQDFGRVRHMIDTNITGTVELVQEVARRMQAESSGRILLTGSVAGVAPFPYQAAYGATKAFVNSFGEALRHELKDSGVSVTVLMPGATDTAFFARAGLGGTRVGEGGKADPADVANAGWEAMMAADDKVVAGFGNKVQALVSRIAPAPLVAKHTGRLSEPGGAQKMSALVPLLAGGVVLGGVAALMLAGSGRSPRSGARF